VAEAGGPGMRMARAAATAAVLVGAVGAVPSGAWGAPATVAGQAVATVSIAGGHLNARTGPSTLHAVAGQLADGSRITVSCQVYSQAVASPLRRTGRWDRLADGRYVADAYVRWQPARPAVRWCGAGGVPVMPTVATGGGPVNVRGGPTTAATKVGELANGTELAIVCQAWGELVSANVTSHSWHLLASGRYVSDALLVWRPSRAVLPWCGQEPPTIPAATPELFLARVAGPARQGMRQYRVPASVTIAQAILESGWGRSGLTRRDHNYFGIKCFGTPGPIALGCRMYATHECGGGRCWPTTASFRAYRNAAGSMADHGRFLVENPRYRNAFAYSGNPDRFAVEIHKAGYATSPTYATNLIKIMKKYDLYRFDA